MLFRHWSYLFHIYKRNQSGKNMNRYLLPHTLILTLFLAGFPLFCGEVLAQSGTSSSSTNFITEDNNQKLKIEYNGKIAIGNDEKSISSISEGGYLKIEKTTFGNSRSILVSNSGKGLDYEYKEGGRTKPFEPNGKAWLAEMLPDLLNSTTLGAEERIDRLYAKGGTGAVLGILDHLKGDHVKSKYLTLLLDKNLKPNEISSVIDALITHISSDHFQYEVYKHVPPAYFRNISQLTRATEAMKSDHFKTLLLKPIFKANVTEGEGQKALEIINLVTSDHFKTEIVKSFSFEKISDKDLKFFVDDVVKKIDSDHFKAEILKTAINSNNLTEDRAILILSGVKSMTSDHFKAETLKQLCRKQSTEKVKQQIREVAKASISSSHFLGEVMKCAG